MQYEVLGADMQYTGDLSMEHAAQKGVHDAVADVIKYLMLGGIVVMVAAVALKEKHVVNLLKRVA